MSEESVITIPQKRKKTNHHNMVSDFFYEICWSEVSAHNIHSAQGLDSFSFLWRIRIGIMLQELIPIVLSVV